ncbi:Protein shq1 [Wickerhamiella sorbophila]|uniref:Protein shq1 n=1 Tax=Wickerhamiella sorbophila TaxID=45607 RepID=A0A2T0FC36_9ASCO|nr:Protein shq1 [Wickerhamiella sorbophila]PRT52525.1 Protein shq1 [Wickerhamiella sorbophila]
MITPQFEVDQDQDFIYVKIRAPYIKASNVEFEVVDERFVFSLQPYYLRLTFPGKLIEDERLESSYDLSTSTIKCRVAKAVPGQEFEDLDMLTKLLAKKAQVSKPVIEEVGDSAQSAQPPQVDEIDWEVEQVLPEPSISEQKYGFNDQYSQIMGVVIEDGQNDINEIPEPEKTSIQQRLLINSTADELFDIDHYLADLYDSPMIQDFLAWDPPLLELTNADKDRMLKLPKRSYMISNPKHVYLGVVQLLFGFCYDDRTNCRDPTVESPWTIGKLTPLLSCLYGYYDRMLPLVRDCTKRALIFPLYRHWDLTLAVWKDVVSILKQGRKAILACFVKLLSIFESDINACYRQIFLEDYAAWIQYSSEKVISSVTTELESALSRLAKHDMGFDLEEYEEAAQEAMQMDNNELSVTAPDSDDED